MKNMHCLLIIRPKCGVLTSEGWWEAWQPSPR